MKTRFSCLGSASLLLTTASLHAQSLLSCRPLEISSAAEPIKHVKGSSLNRAVYEFLNCSPLEKLHVVALADATGNLGGYANFNLWQPKLRGWQSRISFQFGITFLNASEHWPSASLKSIMKSVSEQWGLQFNFGWLKMSFRPLNTYSCLQVDLNQCNSEKEKQFLSALSSLQLGAAGADKESDANLKNENMPANESGNAQQEINTSSLTPLEQLIEKCGLLREKLFPGENPGEAFWCNETEGRTVNILWSDLEKATSGWGSCNGLNAVKVTNVVSDLFGRQKGKVCFVSIKTSNGVTLYFPGFDGQAKQKVSARLQEYERHHPDDITLPSLRQVARNLLVREEAFSEFFLAFAYRANCRDQSGKLKRTSNINELLGF